MRFVEILMLLYFVVVFCYIDVVIFLLYFVCIDLQYSIHLYFYKNYKKDGLFDIYTVIANSTVSSKNECKCYVSEICKYYRK